MLEAERRMGESRNDIVSGGWVLDVEVELVLGRGE